MHDSDRCYSLMSLGREKGHCNYCKAIPGNVFRSSTLTEYSKMPSSVPIYLQGTVSRKLHQRKK